MGKGKGKKGKRGGKPGRGPATARRSEAVAVKTLAAPPQPERPSPAPSSPPPQMAAIATSATSQDAPREAGGAIAGWRPWLQAVGMRIGIYAVLFLGAYCILVGLFSPWGFNIWDTSGRSAWGLFWLALGGGLLYAGWYLSTPDASAGGQGHGNGQKPRR
jgi:hypothetical protein